jgi:hypothetical protein
VLAGVLLRQLESFLEIIGATGCNKLLKSYSDIVVKFLNKELSLKMDYVKKGITAFNAKAQHFISSLS